MSYVIQAVLSNPQRPECGQVTIPFPIPVDQYDQTIDILQAMELGEPVNRDCRVDVIDSHYSVLGKLEGTRVNVDQLDYLAKRLDGFCAGEVSQFQAMAHKLEMDDIKNFINLTFCCQQATVITDFSNLEAAERSHFLTVNGGSARMEELENLDGVETAFLLIDGGGEVVTPYGVVYDNGMKLEHVYNGRQLPAYLYDSICCLVVSASHGPLRAQRGGVTLLLGLGAAVLRPGLTGGDIALVHVHRLGHVQGPFDHAQHELPLGDLSAEAGALALQVGLDPLEKLLRDLEGHRSSIVRCHSCLTSIFLHFVVFE